LTGEPTKAVRIPTYLSPVAFALQSPVARRDRNGRQVDPRDVAPVFKPDQSGFVQEFADRSGDRWAASTPILTYGVPAMADIAAKVGMTVAVPIVVMGALYGVSQIPVIGPPVATILAGGLGEGEGAGLMPSLHLPKLGSRGPMPAGTPSATGWIPGPFDLDWRGSARTYQEALDEAFARTGVDRSDFEITKWGYSEHGKSFPVEWRARGGAEVNVDLGHQFDGPDAPHVGWQTAGKRSSGGAARGHILLDSVPVNRPAKPPLE